MSGSNVETWRVVLTDGGVHEVPVECIGEDSYLARFRHIAAWGGTPRRAVLGLASSCFGDAVEIVSPDSNITSDVHALRNERGVLLREVLRLRAENDMLRKSTDAAVDGVRAMLPEALKIAREAERVACAAECSRAAEGEAARAESDLRIGDTRHAEIFSGRAKALLQMAQALRASTEPTR